MSLPTSCPCCSGSRAHEKSCPARTLVIDWAPTADDLRAESERAFAALDEERRRQYAQATADAL